MAKKYTNIFHSEAIQNLTKLGFLVWKYTIWQPCSSVLFIQKSVGADNEKFSFVLSAKPHIIYSTHMKLYPGDNVTILKIVLQKKWRDFLTQNIHSYLCRKNHYDAVGTFVF
jgi:hypothetical protein